jgi:hypothetical protein
LIPAFTASRVELQPVIQGNGGLSIRGASGGWMAKSLVAAQVALTLALLIGAGLILRSLDRLYRNEPGFAVDRVMTAWLYPTLLGFDYEREMRLYHDLRDTLNTTPGLTSASVSRTAISRGSFNFVGPGFFETVGIPIVEGRGFSAADASTSQRVAIISESIGSLTVGVPLSLAGTRLISNLLFGVVNTDPVTMAAAVCVLLIVILVAAYLPARRASLIDPMTALRTE